MFIISVPRCARQKESNWIVRVWFFVMVMITAALTIGALSGAEPAPAAERTFRVRCVHPSHSRAVWIESAYAAFGPALMQAHRHNVENPGHDAIVLKLRGGRR
jgi:hypothetical protein